MGRKKIDSGINRTPDQRWKDIDYFYGDSYICPVCEKEFVFTIDHKFIVKGGYTCSWKCFLKRVHDTPAPLCSNIKKKQSSKLEIKTDKTEVTNTIIKEEKEEL